MLTELRPRIIKRVLSKLLICIVGLIALTLCGLHFGVLPYYDQTSNDVLVQGPYSVSAATEKFHNNVFVADLHADSLLWGRDLRKRNEHGQVDLPRLHDVGIDLQVFSVVSKVPRNRSYTSTPGDTDALPPLFIASLRSPGTWFSPKQRALVQASELMQLAEIGALSVVLRQQDLSSDGIKGLLALEGMHALEGEASALHELYSAGFRMMGLVHFFDNKVAGSAHGVEKYGLSEFGRSLIPRMEALGITIDLAHASPTAFKETLEMATKPVVVSHGGVKGTCPGNRNLADSQLRAIAQNRGVVGIGYWKGAVCDASIKGIIAAILYTIKIAGIEHVGLGSDFDGNVKTPFDTTGVPMITEQLLASGLSADDVSKVLGGNIRRVLITNLPQR